MNDVDTLKLDGGQVVTLNRFSDLRARYKGPLFIVASGPSVGDFPMQRYRSVPMMAVNGSIVRFSDEGVRPILYLCDDRGVAERKHQAVSLGVEVSQYAALSCTAFGAIAKTQPQALKSQNLLLLERANRLSRAKQVSDRRFAWSIRNDPTYEVEWSLFHQKKNRIGFSRDMSCGYFNARTIAYAALQAAYHMGFEQVFLVGVDMSPQLGQFYDPKGEVVPSRLGDDYEDYILPSFELMSRKVVSPRFTVYNLSAQSRIPEKIIPKLSYTQLDVWLERWNQ
ncbi:lipopolysaccharide core biosynthesis protein [Stutzerimonas nitrititolerans]|uniref:lipopolysaccharide core biosynthesis protein n=1 Tax=Stutzerimonas nitrititolerans TaxID=2482751 RepID=UPI003F802209